MLEQLYNISRAVVIIWSPLLKTQDAGEFGADLGLCKPFLALIFVDKAKIVLYTPDKVVGTGVTRNLGMRPGLNVATGL